MANRSITTEEENLAIELYKSGKDTYEVAEQLGRSQTFVMKVLKRNNIPRRTTHSYTRKYNINENFFNVIDTEEKAYFFGLLCADGNNYRSEDYGKGHDYQISISLQERDKDILLELSKRLAPDTMLKFSNGSTENHQNKYSLKFDSKVVSDQLNTLGCTPRKSLTLQYPACISEHLQNHFLRGYFDGNGSIYFWTKKRKIINNICFVWQLTSSKYFCETAKKIINSYANTNIKSRLSLPKTDNQITTTLSVGGNQQVYRIMSWLYKDATIFLKRKHDKFLELEKIALNSGRSGKKFAQKS